jgi:hypothetical protein
MPAVMPAGSEQLGREHSPAGSFTLMLIWHWKYSCTRSAYLHESNEVVNHGNNRMSFDQLEHMCYLAGHQVRRVFEIVENELVESTTFCCEYINFVAIAIIDKAAKFQ